MKFLAIFTVGSFALASPLFAADAKPAEAAAVASETANVTTVLVKGGG